MASPRPRRPRRPNGVLAGLDPEKVVAALGGGAGGSWILANRSGRMIANEYPLGFRIALHRKDVGNGLSAQGHGDDDNAALARAIRDWSGSRKAPPSEQPTAR